MGVTVMRLKQFCLKYTTPAALIAAFVLLAIAVLRAPAITLADIPFVCANRADSALVKNVARCAEPYARFWSPQWRYGVSRDSVKAVVYTALWQLDSSYGPAGNPRALLLKALLWHYLYQLEVDSAAQKADNLAARVMRTTPTLPEAAWLKGVNLVRAGHVCNGFKILDSLRASQRLRRPDFLMDYAKLSALCFLPARCAALDTFVISMPSPRKSPTVYLRDDELQPSGQTWTVSAENSPNGGPPFFTFSSEYLLYGQITLAFPLLSRSPALGLNVAIAEPFVREIRQPLVWDFDGQKYPMEIRIAVKCGKPETSLDQYLGSLVNNKYDVVTDAGELRHLNAASLRCYAQSIFRNISGRFDEFVVFDRRFKEPASCFYRGNTGIRTGDDFPVRYCIALSTRTAVSEKAGDIFKDFLTQFE
ncbi:MAG: hypothetical protein PHC61_15650 [Chitinivibrionales bacterium]|nr:hypothetical protein [Chitinivibrionales bacterium]